MHNQDTVQRLCLNSMLNEQGDPGDRIEQLTRPTISAFHLFGRDALKTAFCEPDPQWTGEH
jgi:hypothetical protein